MTSERHQDFPDYIERNQKAWSDRDSAYAATMHAKWAGEASWGIWDIPEEELRLLPDVEGRDALDIGCGAAYVCAWMSRRGARVTGIDPTASQLQLASRFQREFDLYFPLVAAGGEMLPFGDETFDLAISEYGAAIWADPYAWIPEAARVLRPGGELIVMGNSALLSLCVADSEEEPAGRELLRPYFGMHRFEWPDSDEVEFHIGHGEWVRLLRANGFEVEDLIEPRPPEDSPSNFSFVTLDWARRWPSEEIWKARKR